MRAVVAAERERQHVIDGIFDLAPGVRLAGAALDQLDDLLGRLAPVRAAVGHSNSFGSTSMSNFSFAQLASSLSA